MLLIKHVEKQLKMGVHSKKAWHCLKRSRPRKRWFKY